MLKHVAENLAYSKKPTCRQGLCACYYRDVDKRGILGSAIPKWTDLIYPRPWQPTQYKAEVLGHQKGEVFINTARFLYLCIPQMGSITFKGRMLLTTTEEYHSCVFILFAINKTA